MCLRLRTRTEELKPAGQRVSAPHCRSGFYILKCHLLDLERFGKMPFTSAAPVEHLDVLAKHRYRETSQWLSKRLQETVQNLKKTVRKVRQTENEVAKNGFGDAVPNKRHGSEKKKHTWCKLGFGCG